MGYARSKAYTSVTILHGPSMPQIYEANERKSSSEEACYWIRCLLTERAIFDVS